MPISNGTIGLFIDGKKVVGVAATALPAGVGKRQFSFAMNLADIAAGDLITAYVPGFNGKIKALNVFALKPASTASKLATLTPKVNSTNTTGGAAALTTAGLNTAGAKVAASAITAANVFGPTDSIGLVASAVTAFVEGVALIVLDLENTDEVNAWTALQTHGLLT